MPDVELSVQTKDKSAMKVKEAALVKATCVYSGPFKDVWQAQSIPPFSRKRLPTLAQ